MHISLKKVLTHSLLAIAIAAPTYVVASVSSAQAGGNHHTTHYKKKFKGGYGKVRRSVRGSIRGSLSASFNIRASRNYRYTTTTQRRVYVKQYQPAPLSYYPPVYTQSHHHHYGPSHHHHYGQPHTRYCR